MTKPFFVLLLAASWCFQVHAEAADEFAKGKALYATNCVTCHGEKFDGQGAAGKYLSPKPRNLISEKFKNGDTQTAISATIKNGLDGTQMVPFGKPKGALTDDECNALAAFIVSLRKT